MPECRIKVSLTSALLLAVNFFSSASAFRHQGESGTAGHGLVRHCPDMVLKNTRISWLYMYLVGLFSTDWQIKSSETITGCLKIFGGFSSENTYCIGITHNGLLTWYKLICVLHSIYKILTTPSYGGKGGGNLQTDAAQLFLFVPIPAKAKKLGILSIYKFSLVYTQSPTN